MEPEAVVRSAPGTGLIACRQIDFGGWQSGSIDLRAVAGTFSHRAAGARYTAHCSLLTVAAELSTP